MTTQEDVAAISAGDYVRCNFGLGIVQSVREDGVYVVTLQNWELASGRSPTLYLQSSALTKVDPLLSPATTTTMHSTITASEASEPPSIFDESMERVAKLKQEAQALFSSGDFVSARSKYLDALTTMQYLSEGMSNQQKAIVFEQSVPCHNNISLCCMNMKGYADSVVFAKNSLLLIDALEKRIAEGSAVWDHLQNERGLTMEKLLAWKKKSLFFMGKAELLKQDYADSIVHLDAALKLIKRSEENDADAVRIKELLVSAKRERSKEQKKEKSTWSKAFKENNNVPDTDDAAAMGTTTTAATTDGSFSSVKKLLGGAVEPPASPSKKPSEANNGVVKKSEDSDGSSYGWWIGLGVLSLVAGGLGFMFLRSRRFR